MTIPLSVFMLRRKRNQIRDTIANYEAKLRESRADLAHVLATLRLYEVDIGPTQFELEALANIFETAQKIPPRRGNGLEPYIPDAERVETPRQQTLERYSRARYSCSGTSIDNSQLWPRWHEQFEVLD